MRRPLRLLLNAALFQIGWLACVFGAHQPGLLLVAGGCLLLHLTCLATPGEWRFIAAASLCGWLVDSMLLNLGVLAFTGDAYLLPGWLALLWPLFASTLRHCLAWTASPWWLASLCGALGGALSYWGGAQLAGVDLPLGTAPSLLILALIWALLLPAFHRLGNSMTGAAKGSACGRTE